MYQADIHDALAIPQWEGLEPILRRVVEPRAEQWEGQGLAVDLGAGTGLSTCAFAGMLPGLEWLACEPHPALRACLVTRVLCAGVRDRTTCCEWDAAYLVQNLDEPVSFFSALNMLGHVQEDERKALWRWLAQHLTEDGFAVVGPFVEHAVTATASEETVYAREQVGRRTYEGAARPELTPDGGVWHMTWRILEDGHVLDERRATSSWDSLTREGVAIEARAAGLEAELLPADLLLLSACAPSRTSAR